MRLSSTVRSPHLILALASLAQFVVLLVVFSVGALAPLLRDALHLSREQIGALTALFFLAAIPVLHTYHELLAVMFLAGVGHGTVMVLTNKALYDWFPRERLATAMGTKFAAMSCAGIVAGTAMPTLALWVGWRQAFAVVGGLTL